MKEIYVRTKLVNGTYVYAPKGTENTYGTVLIDNDTLKYYDDENKKKKLKVNGAALIDNYTLISENGKLKVDATVINNQINEELLNKINKKLDKTAVVQETGNSTTNVMSQNAVRENFARLVDGKVPASQLPSYVDDVLEYVNKDAFPKSGETSKIYVDKSTNLTYRWSSNSNNYIMIGGGDLNIENGTGTGSLVQKRLKSDGVTWTTAKAYQGAGTALGGGTQAGRTEEEFNAYFWDSVNNVALNGGKGKNSSGEILDNAGLTYSKSYSFAFAANEDNKAIARGSAAFGRYNTTYNPGEFVCGDYADNNRDPRTVFAVGTGIDDSRRSTGFEVRTDGYCYSYGKSIATQEYVDNRTVTKQGTSYVVYINEANGKSTVMPYRFQKQSIVDAEYQLMFQPMLDGRLYTRYPTDEYHVANKGYVDEKISKIDTKALKVTVW